MAFDTSASVRLGASNSPHQIDGGLLLYVGLQIIVVSLFSYYSFFRPLTMVRLPVHDQALLINFFLRLAYH